MWSYRGNHTNHLDVYHLIHFSSPHGLFLRLSEREKAELVFPNTRRYRREANSSGTWPLPGLWINLGRGPCSFQKQNRLYHLFFGDPACFFIISCYDMTLRTGLTRRNRIAISGGCFRAVFVIGDGHLSGVVQLCQFCFTELPIDHLDLISSVGLVIPLILAPLSEPFPPHRVRRRKLGQCERLCCLDRFRSRRHSDQQEENACR